MKKNKEEMSLKSWFLVLGVRMEIGWLGKYKITSNPNTIPNTVQEAPNEEPRK